MNAPFGFPCAVCARVILWACCQGAVMLQQCIASETLPTDSYPGTNTHHSRARDLYPLPSAVAVYTSANNELYLEVQKGGANICAE